MDYKSLNNELISTFEVKENKIVNETFKVKQMGFLQLRDILLGLGRIYKEDFESNIYTVIINGGFRKKNKTISMFKLTEEGISVAMYAKEGLINQHTCEGVMDEFRRRIEKYL